MAAEIRIGLAGWNYWDWNGIVYPESASRFDKLNYIASYFDTVEINSSFYRPLTARSSKSWVKKVEHNPKFKFAAKLYKGFTHLRRPDLTADEDAFRRGIDPLVDADKFGALVLQFPPSFKNVEANNEYLSQLFERFKDYTLVVEMRDLSWNEPVTYQFLESRGVGFCNIDQPLFEQSFERSAVVTSKVGYVRLHGRNFDNLGKAAFRGAKYDYFYSEEELQPWIDSIRKLSKSAEQVYVQTNNQFKGKGLTNALQIKAAIENSRVKVPVPLLRAFPQLEKIAL